MELRQKIEDYQTFEKSALIVAGTTLISVGVTQLNTNQWPGFGLIVLGVISLIAREIFKLRK